MFPFVFHFDGNKSAKFENETKITKTTKKLVKNASN